MSVFTPQGFFYVHIFSIFFFLLTISWALTTACVEGQPRRNTLADITNKSCMHKSHIQFQKATWLIVNADTLLSFSFSLTHMYIYTDYLPHFLGGHTRSSVHCCPLVISVSTHFLYQFNYITSAIIKIRIKLFQVKGWWCEGNHKWSGSVWKPHGSVKVEMQV